LSILTTAGSARRFEDNVLTFLSTADLEPASPDDLFRAGDRDSRDSAFRDDSVAAAAAGGCASSDQAAKEKKKSIAALSAGEVLTTH
jgi:hypothetical protein